MDEIYRFIADKVILVTGGGGSIGSELCRQIASHSPKQLIIVDIYENTTYEVQLELKRKHPELNLTVLIASVRDSSRMDAIFKLYQPDIVFHAAAHKHVPLMEHSNSEAVKNNVFGTNGSAGNGYNPKDISPLRNIKKENWHKHYADPENHDFRVKKDSYILETNPSILLDYRGLSS